MLNKEDKRFILNTVTGVVSEAVTASEKRTNKRIDSLRDELKDEIHQQGILLEHMNDKIDIVAENTVDFNRRVKVLEECVGVL